MDAEDGEAMTTALLALGILLLLSFLYAIVMECVEKTRDKEERHDR